MKKFLLSFLVLLFVTLVFLGPVDAVVEENTFSHFIDVKDSNPNAEYIADLFYKNIIHGMTDERFEPESSLTREQFAKIIVEGFNIEYSEEATPFNDLKSEWSKPYIIAAYHADLIKGVSDSKFNPRGELKRQEAAVIVWRLLEKNGIAPNESDYPIDLDDTDDWAKKAVKNIMALGLRTERISNEPYRSKDVMTRGDASALISLAIRELQYGWKRNQNNLVTLNDDLVYLNKESVNMIENISFDDSLITFKNMNDQIKNIQKDDIIALPPTNAYPLGSVHKITSINYAEGIIFQFIEPEFDEVVSEINVFIEIELDRESVVLLEDYSSSFIDRSEVRALSTPKLKFEFEEDIMRLKLTDLNIRGIDLSGEVTLEEPVTIIDIDYSNYKFESYHVEFKAKHSTSLKVGFDPDVDSNEFIMPLARFVVPIPNTPLGIEFVVNFKVEVDGYAVLSISQMGYMSIGISNEGGIGHFNSTPSYDGFELGINADLGIKHNIHPSIFQLRLKFFGIEQTLIGLKAEMDKKQILGSSNSCSSESIKLYMDAKARAEEKAFINLEVEFELYNWEKILYEIDTCDLDTELVEDKKPSSFLELSIQHTDDILTLLEEIINLNYSEESINIFDEKINDAYNMTNDFTDEHSLRSDAYSFSVDTENLNWNIDGRTIQEDMYVVWYLVSAAHEAVYRYFDIMEEIDFNSFIGLVNLTIDDVRPILAKLKVFIN